MNYIYYFKPQDNNKYIQKIVDEIYLKMKAAQFTDDRVLLAFYPGFYDINIKVGFFTEVIGLGINPSDTIIKGLSVEATFLSHYNALCNFDRAIANLSVDNEMLFAVSQGTSLRRINVNGDLYLHHNGGAGSGGFIANSTIQGKIYSGPQQQYFLRDTYFEEFIGDNWNMFFINCKNAPKDTWPKKQYTSILKGPYNVDKPYLVNINNKLCVTFNRQDEETQYLDIDTFYQVDTKDDSKIIQSKLDEGYNLLFNPGIYQIDKPLIIKNDDTIILGLGYATLVANNKDSVIKILGNRCQIAGILFDANHSNNLLTVDGNNCYLFDIFARIGGAKDIKTYCETAIDINGNHCFGDNFWLWRADHTLGVGIDINVANQGMIVNGNDNVFYALMVEHFLKYQTTFNGERCKTYMSQSETPYEYTKQEDYYHDGVNGYASYKVNDKVKQHEGYGIGVYTVFLKAPIWLDSAIEAPSTAYFYHIITLELGPNKGVKHEINNIEGVRKTPIMKYVLEYK